MAQIDYNSWKQIESDLVKPNANTHTITNKVGYFSLKGNGQEAIVRFMIDSPDDFDIVGVHRVQVGDKLRAVNCIGDRQNPADTCPLCASGNGRQYKFYIHLIEYVREDNGQIVGIPKVWERSSSYINKFSNLINEYGPLSDVVFKVKRNGEAGSKDTTYDILMANPNVYRGDLYPKDTKAFEGYKAVGTIVANWGKDKLAEIVGETPTGTTEKVEQPKQTYQAPEQPVARQYTPAYRPTNTNDAGVQRPNRY